MTTVKCISTDINQFQSQNN